MEPKPALTDVQFITELTKLDGAKEFMGECSYQAYFELANGKTLRIGVTDDDVTDRIGLWADTVGGR